MGMVCDASRVAGLLRDLLRHKEGSILLFSAMVGIQTSGNVHWSLLCRSAISNSASITLVLNLLRIDKEKKRRGGRVVGRIYVS